MTEIEILLRLLQKDGKSPRAIATELYERGLKNNLGKFLTPDMVEGYLRHAGTEPPKPPTVLPRHALKKAEADAYESGMPLHSKKVEPLGEPRHRPQLLRQWPPGVNYGGENSYPLYEPPYNNTHQPQYQGSALRGMSSAGYAVEGF